MLLVRGGSVAGTKRVTAKLQTPTEYQNHPSALPIRFVAMSFQPCGVCRKTAAVTVAAGAGAVPGDRVAVSTILKLRLSVVTASSRRW